MQYNSIKPTKHQTSEHKMQRGNLLATNEIECEESRRVIDWEESELTLEAPSLGIFDTLPPEARMHIFRYLSPAQLASLMVLNKQFKDESEYLWRLFFKELFYADSLGELDSKVNFYTRFNKKAQLYIKVIKDLEALVKSSNPVIPEFPTAMNRLLLLSKFSAPEVFEGFIIEKKFALPSQMELSQLLTAKFSGGKDKLAKFEGMVPFQVLAFHSSAGAFGILLKHLLKPSIIDVRTLLNMAHKKWNSLDTIIYYNRIEKLRVVIDLKLIDRKTLHASLVPAIISPATSWRMINTLIELGVDLNQQYGDTTPLLSAIKLNKNDIAEYLIEKGAHIENPSALNHAVHFNNNRLATFLLKHGAKVTDGLALSTAARKGEKATFEQLLSFYPMGGSVEMNEKQITQLINAAAMGGNKDIFDLVLKNFDYSLDQLGGSGEMNEEQITQLICAAATGGNKDIFDLVWEKIGYKIDSLPILTVLGAVTGGNEEIFNVIYEKASNLNIYEPRFRGTFKNGQLEVGEGTLSVFEFALHANNENIVEALLRHYPLPQSVYWCSDFLSIACRNGNAKIVNLFLSHVKGGIDVNHIPITTLEILEAFINTGWNFHRLYSALLRYSSFDDFDQKLSVWYRLLPEEERDYVMNWERIHFHLLKSKDCMLKALEKLRLLVGKPIPKERKTFVQVLVNQILGKVVKAQTANKCTQKKSKELMECLNLLVQQGGAWTLVNDKGDNLLHSFIKNCYPQNLLRFLKEIKTCCDKHGINLFEHRDAKDQTPLLSLIDRYMQIPAGYCRQARDLAEAINYILSFTNLNITLPLYPFLIFPNTLLSKDQSLLSQVKFKLSDPLLCEFESKRLEFLHEKLIEHGAKVTEVIKEEEKGKEKLIFEEGRVPVQGAEHIAEISPAFSQEREEKLEGEDEQSFRADDKESEEKSVSSQQPPRKRQRIEEMPKEPRGEKRHAEFGASSSSSSSQPKRAHTESPLLKVSHFAHPSLPVRRGEEKGSAPEKGPTGP